MAADCEAKLPARANECGDGSSFPGRAPGRHQQTTAHSLQLITFLAFYTSAGPPAAAAAASTPPTGPILQPSPALLCSADMKPFTTSSGKVSTV